MKRRKYFIIILLALFYLLPQNNYAQRQLVTSTINSNNFKQQAVEKRKVIELIEHESKTRSVNIFQFDSTVLKESIFDFNIFSDESLIIHKDETDYRNDNDFSLYCHIQGLKSKEGSLVLTYFNGELSGNLNYKFKNYAIRTLGHGISTVYEIDFKEFPQDDAHAITYKDKKIDTNFNGEKSATNSMKIAAPACKIRILVAFTPNAEAKIKTELSYSSMVQFINQAIAETNQSYLNSNINYRVELACAIRVNYSESGNYDTDLNRFQSTNDGYMDEIHSYRDLYSADVCELIFDNASSCGLASAIQANASTAFCVTHYKCVLGVYSFGHEIAHLFGCRHNPEADNTNTPFPYGHGYVYVPGMWRTIMAYDISGQTRLQYYSNPNVTLNGVPMGNTNVSNNARVLNENAASVSAFRVTPSTLVLNSSNSIINDETGDATATTVVLLEPGFQVLTNSTFNAYIKSCSELALAADNLIAKNTKENLVAGQGLFNVYPNPASSVINLAFSIAQNENNAAIKIYSIDGQLVKEILLGNISKGKYQELIDISKLSNGMYAIILQLSNSLSKTTFLLAR